MIRAILLYILALYLLGQAVKEMTNAARKQGYNNGWFDGRFANTVDDVHVHGKPTR
jgi:diadenosine tetraphosphate (Ap4A) HIT family hydrolase